MSKTKHLQKVHSQKGCTLYNICNDKHGYKLFLEDEDIVNKEVKEDENNENQTEYTE